MEILTQSAQETEKLGQKIAARILGESRGPYATILALYGELGSGKTTFVQGLGRGLGLPHRLLSPTFMVVREYPLKTENFNHFYHLDLYSIETETELSDFGFSEIFINPFHLVAIEWAEKLEKWLPKERTNIYLEVRDQHRSVKITK